MDGRHTGELKRIPQIPVFNMLYVIFYHKKLCINIHAQYYFLYPFYGF